MRRLDRRRRRILILLAVMLALAVSYEIAFRLVTARCGSVDYETTWPPSVFYTDDLTSSLPWRGICFGFRTQLPFGKVRLNGDVYVDGGRFYQRNPDGSWYDETNWMIAIHKARHAD